MSAGLRYEDLAADPRLAWVAEILVAVREGLASRQGLPPAMFFVKTRDHGDQLIRIGQMVDFNDPQQKEVAAKVIKQCLDHFGDATACALVTDSYRHAVRDPEALAQIDRFGAEAAVARWTVEERARWLETREALFIRHETVGASDYLVQYYRRDRWNRRLVTLEEVDVVRSTDPGVTKTDGRFTNFLPENRRPG